jgi:hypothetical protein
MASDRIIEDYATMQALGLMYLNCKAQVLSSTLGPSVWETSAHTMAITEAEILREGAWAILSVGLSVQVVQHVHKRLSPCFLEWQSAADIVANACECRQSARTVFAHNGKIAAIIELAARVASIGHGRFMVELSQGSATASLPFFGPASTEHLRMNLGIDTVKPDRHLRRLADQYDCDVTTMCHYIAAYTGDGLRLIDRVLWTHESQFRAH